MFRSKTVFILGAGASAEVGLPVGTKLLDDVCEIINLRFEHFGEMKSGDGLLRNALELVLDEGRSVEKFNKHLHTAWQIIESSKQAISIDNIVDGMEDSQVELVAKLGIVRAIHKAEADSTYFTSLKDRPESLQFERFSETWYSSLTKLITENRRKSEVGSFFENLEFISFNYDRCLEHYIPRSIASYYGMPVDEVVEQFKNVPIHRPYGIAGEISWRSGSGMAHGFGLSSAEYLVESALGIKTFTEGVENPESLEGIKNALATADRIVFLGSAFHRQNLELLKCRIGTSCQVFATASGISASDLNVVRDEIGQIFGISIDRRKQCIQFSPVHCARFFQEYWRTLTS